MGYESEGGPAFAAVVLARMPRKALRLDLVEPHGNIDSDDELVAAVISTGARGVIPIRGLDRGVCG